MCHAFLKAVCKPIINLVGLAQINCIRTGKLVGRASRHASSQEAVWCYMPQYGNNDNLWHCSVICMCTLNHCLGVQMQQGTQGGGKAVAPEPGAQQAEAAAAVPPAARPCAGRVAAGAVHAAPACQFHQCGSRWRTLYNHSETCQCLALA